MSSKGVRQDGSVMKEMGTEKNKTLSESQKKRLVQWEIPHLISLLRRQHPFSFMHLLSPPSPLLYETAYLCFNGKTAFPLLVGDRAFGVLLCFQVLSPPGARKIRAFIDHYLYKWFHLRGLDSRTPVFPLLLKRKEKEERLKTAHELYLKSASFAFLNTENMLWKEKMFQDLNGVFACVPSWEALSDFQKRILHEDLKRKKLSCHLVLGLKAEEDLPENWRAFFPGLL